jgi:cell division septation protein DedD
VRCTWSFVALLLAALPVRADVLREASELKRRLQYNAAQQRLQQSLPDLHDDARAQALVAMASLTTEPRDARRWLAEAAKSGSESTRRAAALELAQLEFARGNYRNAITQTEAYPADPQAALWHGLSAAALGDASSMPAVLEPARKNDFAVLLLGWSALQRGDAQAALDILTPQSERRRADYLPATLLWKTQAQVSLGLADDAARTSGELRERYPESPEALLVQQALPAAHPATGAGAGGAAVAAAMQFTIQLGAFEDRTNALRLRGSLARDLGPTQIIEDAPAGRPRIFRVAVGAFDSRDAATAFAAEKLSPRGLAWQVVPVPEDTHR